MADGDREDIIQMRRVRRRGNHRLGWLFLWMCVIVNPPLGVLAGQVGTFRDWLFLLSDYLWLNIVLAGVPMFLVAALWAVHIRRDRDFVWKGVFYLLPLINLIALFRMRGLPGIHRWGFRLFFCSYAFLQFSALILEVSLPWGIANAITCSLVLVSVIWAFRRSFIVSLLVHRPLGREELVESPGLPWGNRIYIFQFRRCDVNLFVDVFGALLLGLLLAYCAAEGIIYLTVSRY